MKNYVNKTDGTIAYIPKYITKKVYNTLWGTVNNVNVNPDTPCLIIGGRYSISFIIVVGGSANELPVVVNQTGCTVTNISREGNTIKFTVNASYGSGTSYAVIGDTQ